MRLDGHIHATVTRTAYEGYTPEMRAKLYADMAKAGISGGSVFSVDPLKYKDWTPERRMKDVIDLCKGEENLFSFFWIDPLEDGAVEQVQQAVDLGVDGFKMICSKYKPGDTKSMDVLSKIAELNKPVLFHSGICWDGNDSANNNRPGNFEALIDIPKIKFALAHVSWPWYDECIAVYGKFNNAYFMRPDVSCEMFIDLTPGTPRPWREEVFRHMLEWSEYDYRYNLIYGTDCNLEDYNVSWCKEWQERDDALYEKMITEDVEDFKEHVYCKNLLRFLGKSDEVPQRKIPMVGE